MLLDSAIEMRKTTAEEKLAATRRALRRYKRPDERLRHLEAGYAALAKGSRVILLSQAIAAGGWDELGRPRLAVARADRPTVVFRTNYAWLTFDASGRFGSSPTLRRSFRRSLMPSDERWEQFRSAEAIVPMIPPDVHEQAGHPDRRKTFILWEADWEAVPLDPALLRQVVGDLYEVLTVWNLTELERLVMSAAASEVG